MNRIMSMTTALRTAIAMAVISILSVTAANAETLMMPKRDGQQGVQLIVWGVTTQANGTPFTLDFGDGSPVTTGNVVDRSYIAFGKSYATAGTYTAVLTVGAESSSVVIRIFDPTALPGGIAGEAARGLKINMAIEDGLRYLWTTQQNRASNFPAGLTTFWNQGSSWPQQWTALATLAFQNHGYRLTNDNALPTGLYEKYVVRRGLNYVIQNLQTQAISAQAAGTGTLAGQPLRDPCVGLASDVCTGLRPTSIDPGYSTGLAMIALASSNSLARKNLDVGGYTLNRTYGEILQRLSNALAWGQADGINTLANGGPGRGGFIYNFNTNTSDAFDGSTVGWAVLGFLDAAAVGTVVPDWVKSELAFGLNAGLNDNGSLDYRSNGNPTSQPAPNNQTGNHYATNLEKAGVGLQSMFFTGEVGGARVNLTKQYISDRWNSGRLGNDYTGWGCGAIPNRGCAYAMFNNFKGMKLQGITTLPGVTRPAGPGAIPAGDWYADYQDWLVTNQISPTTIGGGNWSMTFSAIANSADANAAIGLLILSPVALVLPDGDKFASVGLTPPTNTAVEGGTHTVTAKAESTGGSPVPGATVNFTILTGPNAGMTGTDVTDANGEATFTYTDAGPVPSYGTDRIQATIGSLSSNIVLMIWTPLNQPPVATDDAYATDEDTAVSGNTVTDPTADSDPNGDTIIATLVTDVTNGTLSFANGAFTYTPNANYCGPDAFSYKVNDGTVDGNVANVSITVACVNDPPVADDNAHVTPEDTAVSGNATSSDIDGGAPTYALGSGPANGSVVFNADGSYTYTPNANYDGPDSFTFTVSDGNGGSDTGMVTIDVTPVNDAPVANDNAHVTPEDTAVSGNATSSDIDGGAPTYALGTGPTNGSVVFNADGSYTYTPNANYNGSDLFTFTVSDGNGGSDTGTVTINVTPVNDAPVANDDSFSTNEDTPLPGFVRFNDTSIDLDGDTLSWTLASSPSNGSVTLLNVNGRFTYTPNANFCGPDSFTYEISDGTASDPATVTIEVTCVNDPPVADDNAHSTPEDTPVGGTATSSDLDGGAPAYALDAGPTNGTVAFNADGTYTYTPNANFNGGDSFTFTVSDGNGGSDTGSVTITVTPVNDAPVANDDSFSTNEDTPLPGFVRFNDTSIDLDGDTLSWTLTSSPSNGSVTLLNVNGRFTYRPNANFCGPDSFTYEIGDGTASDPATVTIEVNCANDPPVAIDNSHTTPEDTPVSGAATSSDIDGGVPTYALASGPSNGTVAFNASGAYTYTPNANYNGPDSFTFTVSDGNGGSDSGQVNINVTPVNDAPFCSAAAPSISQIWPPNHKLVNVSVFGVTDPVEGSAITITINSIWQDEPTNTQGDGNTPVDGYGVGTATAQVRAERAGNPKTPGNGRMYHINFTGTDAQGGTCTGTVKVGVPHDQGNGSTVIDGGPIYKSTAP
jgi:Bacterial Ig domain/Bacterial Ig-like domain (group 1)